MHVIWMWIRFGSRLGPISNQFWIFLGSQNYSKNGPKIHFFGIHFKTLFYEVLKLFKCLLGAFPSLLCSSWQPPRREKYGFHIVKRHFLEMILFGALKLFIALLDPSWLLLGPIWSQNGPENHPRNYPKLVQKMIQKTAPPKMNSKTILGSNLGHFGPKKTRAHFVLALLVQLQIS